jgi:hypothetical protein
VKYVEVNAESSVRLKANSLMIEKDLKIINKLIYRRVFIMKKTVVINYTDDSKKVINIEATDKEDLFNKIDLHVVPTLNKISGVSILPFLN